MSGNPKQAIPFNTGGIPIVGSITPAMRLKIDEEIVEILPPPADAGPDRIDAFGALAGLVLMTKSMAGAPPWPKLLMQATRSYRDRFQPIILGD